MNKLQYAICPDCNRKIGLLQLSATFRRHDNPSGIFCEGSHKEAKEILSPGYVLITPGMSFGQILRAYRLEARLTQVQLAAKINYDRETISAFERDLPQSHPDYLIRAFENALELPPNTLWVYVPQNRENQYCLLREVNYPAAKLVDKLLKNALPTEVVNQMCDLAGIKRTSRDSSNSSIE